MVRQSYYFNLTEITFRTFSQPSNQQTTKKSNDNPASPSNRTNPKRAIIQLLRIIGSHSGQSSSQICSQTRRKKEKPWCRCSQRRRKSTRTIHINLWPKFLTEIPHQCSKELKRQAQDKEGRTPLTLISSLQKQANHLRPNRNQCLSLNNEPHPWKGKRKTAEQ